MALKWFKAQPADASFLDSAPNRLTGVFEIQRPASEVWDELIQDNTLWWCRILDDVTWTSPRPLAVGATRTVKSLRGLNMIHEEYFRWEEGRRKSFQVLEASSPLFRRFAEDYVVEPTGDSSCRFTWVIAYEPTTIGRLGGWVNKRLLGTLFTDTRKHYDAR